jgi:CRP-like cAMP-binding protein
MEQPERVAALSAFLDCSSDVAVALDSKMSQHDFDHKDILVHQGDPGSQIWLILDGNAQLQVIGFEGQVTLLAAHGPGEIFGAFPEEAESKVEIKVYGQLTALQIASHDLQALLRDHPSLGRGLSKIMGNQFNAILDRLASHVTLTAKGRVYRELLLLAGDQDGVSPPPLINALALTAQTTRETASRAINEVVRRGIITRDNKRWHIVSRGLLEGQII